MEEAIKKTKSDAEAKEKEVRHLAPGEAIKGKGIL